MNGKFTDMTAGQREFDIVLYGATGFVGKLTAEYLAKAGGQARIALAGRAGDELQALALLLPAATEMETPAFERLFTAVSSALETPPPRLIFATAGAM